jgi:integrase
MRKGYQSLALLVQETLKYDPHNGHLFVFRGRRGDLLKVLWHDGQGQCLFSKRLERGRFIWPSPADGVVTISSAQLGYLLNRSAHGCRKIGATRAAEAGASVAQLNAIFGWSGTAMASLYTQAADRKLLAREAIEKLTGRNETATSIPSPGQEVRAAGEKSK